MHHVQASIILGVSYLCFWCGELVLGTSSVLAVVMMGLYMNQHKSAISPGCLHFLHEFYEMVSTLNPNPNTSSTRWYQR